MRARVTVTLKAGVLDPQGKAIEGALRSLGIDGVTSVRQGKLFDVELDGVDRGAAEAALGRACERLLANTVIESYRVELEDAPAASSGPVPGAGEPAPRRAPDPARAAEEAAAAAAMPTEGHP